MKINIVNNNIKNKNKSFNGIYTLKGKEDVLDEICWYLSKVRKNPERKFDFIDIRSDKTLKSYIETLPGGFISIDRDFRRKSFEDRNSTFDLFITGQDKLIVEPVMRNMVEDTFNMTKNNLPMAEKVKKLLSKLNEMDDKVCHGKPVSTVINFMVLKSYMGKIFDLSKLREIKAEEAYESLQKDKFDIFEGDFK